jgi:predicted ATP-grasp superfamily ATP-dependent carboligase
LPIAEQSVIALLPTRDRLFPATIPFPDIADVDALRDKERLLREAAGLGIMVPAQKVVRDAEDLASVDVSPLRYPVVIKPARSVSECLGPRATFSVSYACDEKELTRKIRVLPPAAFPLLLQERIVGPGIGIFLLLWDGQVMAEFAHQRLTEKPPSGGVSVYRESIVLDENLRDQSVALLKRFNWRGVAMVEYKRDSASGQSYLMEINGRFWGSLQLAIDSGVDFPRILIGCALGESFDGVPTYHAGVRSRWWWGQIDHVVGRVRRSRQPEPVPPGSRSFPRVLGDLLIGPIRRRDYEEVLRWNDPRPFFNETIRWIRRQ